MAMALLGEVDIEFELNLDGHRDYFLTWLVETNNKWIGPWTVLQCPGLPVPGAIWSFGPYGDQNYEQDQWAYCQGYAKVTPKVSPQKNFWWLVRQHFSTRPFERPSLYDYGYTTPFAEFPKVRGGFIKKTEEAVFAGNDIYCIQDGQRTEMRSYVIRNTAWQRFTGKVAEFDKSFSRITISTNIPDQGNNISFYEEFKDTVNDEALWGFFPRTVKLDEITYERMVTGPDNWFFVVNLEFEIDQRYDPVEETYYSGHDRRILNQGTDVVSEGGDKNNPKDTESFRKVPDREKGSCILDSEGRPWVGSVDELSANPPVIVVEHFPGINFVEALGVPAVI